MKNAIKLSILSCALLSQLNADNSYTIDTINVTASQGTTLNKKDVTDSVTIITKEQLEESRISTLDEALNKLGGIAMTQSGGAGKQTSIFLRGMSSKRILVLIDGVRYNDPTSIGAAAQFSQIMLYNIEQIEIIKGAQSGVWGADASGGVINIITSKAKKGLHGSALVEYGSFDSKKASMSASYATKEYDILIGGSVYNIDGFSAVEPKKSDPLYGERYDDLGLEKDKYENTTLNAKLGYNITDTDRIEVSIQAINALSNTDSAAGHTEDSPIDKTEYQNRFYNIAYKHNGDTHKINVQYNLSTLDRELTYNSSGQGVIVEYKGSVNEVKLDDKITYAKDSFIRVGGSYQKFEQEEITANTTKNYSATSAFVTNYNKLNLISNLNTILTESLRYDSYDNFDDAFTGKLGVKQFVYNDYFVSSNVGTGYNAPTLSQLYGQWGANPDLKPESSLTADITLGNDVFWVTGFYNEVTNLIDYDSNFNYVQVDGKSKISGIELGYEDYYFDVLGVSAAYTYIKTEDKDGKELARRPKNQVDAKATYYVDENWDLGVSAQYIGERYDSADKLGAQTGEYTVVNFVSNVKVNKVVTVYGKIDNLTDKYYQTVDGYATAGRSLYVGLIAKY